MCSSLALDFRSSHIDCEVQIGGFSTGLGTVSGGRLTTDRTLSIANHRLLTVDRKVTDCDGYTGASVCDAPLSPRAATASLLAIMEDLAGGASTFTAGGVCVRKLFMWLM